MQGFARVLLKMQTLNTDFLGRAVGQINFNHAFANNRVLVLRNLIALRQIGIEVVFALKDRVHIDLGIQAQTGAYSLFNAKLVDNRQHTRHARINGRHLRIRCRAEICRSAGKEF